MELRRAAFAVATVAWLAGIALASRLAGAPAWLLGAGVAAGLAALAMAILAARRGAARTAPLAGTAPAWGWIGLALLAVGMLMLAAARGGAAATPDAGSVARDIGRSVTIHGSVSGEPDLRAKGEYIVVSVSQVQLGTQGALTPADGAVEVFATGAPGEFAPQYGDSVAVSGTLKAPAPGTPPGTTADLGAPKVTILARGGGNPLWGAVFALRENLANGLARSLPAPEAALIIGILLGLKTPELRARLGLFTRTGTIHLVVTSGLKVTLVGSLVAAAARRLGRGARLVLPLGAVAGYVVLSGLGPAAVRAGIMGAILVLTRWLGREYDAPEALCCAIVLMTMITPGILWDAGFQLSVAGTLGVIALAGRFRAPIARGLRRLPGGGALAEALAATLAAQLATLPLVAVTFGIVSLIAPLTNLLLVPALPLFLGLGAVVGTLGWLAPGAGAVAGNVAWPILRLADLIIEGGAAVPGAALTVSNVPGWLTPLWVGAVALVPAVWRRPTATHGTSARLPAPVRAGIALTGLIALVAGSLLVATPAPAATLTLSFLDVGPGGPATLIQVANGATVLIDGGADGPALLDALAARLPFWQRDLSLVIVTDTRAGELTGAQAALGAYHIATAADPGDLYPTAPYVAWFTALQAAHIPLVRLARGATVTLGGGATLAALAPAHPLFTGADAQDDNALILRLDAPGISAILAGDAGPLALALAAGSDLHADLVQVCLEPGTSITPTSEVADLLALTLPRLLVIAPSARGKGTSAPAPPDDPAALFGAQTLRTADAGTVVIAADAAGWWLAS